LPSGGGVPQGLLGTQDVGVAPSGRILCDVTARTLPREGLWLAQTPQMFPAVALLAALRRAAGDDGITDEASAMERAGCSP
jgi:2-C-methyl-D-erythritol 4-phosphate cytidylyltransferase